MRYGLGIDTGGTYTDAVVFDFENEKVIGTAKSITVKEDLTTGINGAIEQLPPEVFDMVKLVSLSTTLATNACVEGKGSRAKLVMIGCYEKIAARYGKEYGLPETKEIIFLGGGHNQQGKILNEPDWNFLKARVNECKHETDAFAVVELWGIRNAGFEKKAKEMIADWTGMQVVCGHELTGEINSLKRAASALLNAQLIPIINEFLNAVKSSLKQKGINAPLVIVRGDGSLMSEKFARSKPVETLLCGPAASVAGGISLTGEKNCIIVDMGGTTSDIAIVKNGIPKLASEGANIGKWRTGIKSILINTVGLGGDSLIRHNSENKLTIGPVRAAPLSWAASRWPGILGRIKTIYEGKKRHTVSLCEFFYLIRDISKDNFYSREERDISYALKAGPLSITELAEEIGTSIYEIKIKRLEQYGIVMRCGLTPTDIMHLTGDFTGWERDAAYYGAMIMAHQINASLDELIDMVNENVKERLYYNIVRMLMEDEDESLLKGGISKQLDSLLTASFRKKRKAEGSMVNGDDFMVSSFTTSATLVGIGAPIHIYLPGVAKALNANCIIPENAGVANAIGAITGNVMAKESVVIKPQYSAAGITGYIGFSPSENKEFQKHADAVEWAKTKANELARKSALERGADEVEISVTVNNNEAEISSTYKDDTKEDVGGPDGSSGNTVKIETAGRDKNCSHRGNQLLLETIVTARAAGKIKWV